MDMATGVALPILLGLAAASAWGGSDFSGGLAAKRQNVFIVVAVSQSVGLLLLILLALMFNEPLPDIHYLALGAAAGLVGEAGLLALYRGLAIGRMGVVAPLSAVISAIIPVVFSCIVEGLPAPLQMAGILLGLASVWLVSRPPGSLGFQAAEVGLAFLAGLAFGGFFILIDLFSSEAVFWPLASGRIASVLAIIIFLTISRRWEAVQVRQIPLMVLVGILDTLGNLFFAIATRTGRLDLTSVLGSLYPAGTVLLARVILKERMARLQWAGVALALSAIVLISL